MCVCERGKRKGKRVPKTKANCRARNKEGAAEQREKGTERAREMDFWNEIKVICCRFVPFKWNQNILHK